MLATFFSIQIVGIDAGVGVGLIISIIDHAATTSNQDSKHHVRKIERRSRKVRSLEVRNCEEQNDEPQPCNFNSSS